MLYLILKYLLCCMFFDLIVDIWSVGCIMAELLTGRTLFPGTDRILSLLSLPYTNKMFFGGRGSVCRYLVNLKELLNGCSLQFLYTCNWIYRIVAWAFLCTALLDSHTSCCLVVNTTGFQTHSFYLFQADSKALLNIEFCELHARISKEVCVLESEQVCACDRS